MNKNTSISFVIPAYNCSSTIVEAIDSIVNSNFEIGDEIIIVNDGSTDNTAHVLKNLEKKYPFLIIITNIKNKGCPATRNIGINKASNPLIFNLDSDNILPNNSVEKLKNFLISNNAEIASFSEYHFFKENIKKITHKWTYQKK